mmetsp:Transcript_100972/g.182205  ORF Transcript_100972/g.182205 Transcript_100972/m.182205 type:complete len:610 (+) Transcript_100972:87-1916(+)
MSLETFVASAAPGHALRRWIPEASLRPQQQPQAHPARSSAASGAAAAAAVAAVAAVSAGLRGSKAPRRGSAGASSGGPVRASCTLRAQRPAASEEQPRRPAFRKTPAVVTAERAETVEEAMLRLSHTISDALESGDLLQASRAQREMRKVQLEKPSAACRHLIHEDCLAATALLRSGESVSLQARIRATKKLGRWLRWPNAAKKSLVPYAMVLEGLLSALRSEPQVAWVAQCALFHAARCEDNKELSVRDGTRGTVNRMLLHEPTPFPFCLPELTERTAEAYETAITTPVVRDFFGQLQGVMLVDPGYGNNIESYDLAVFAKFAGLLGRSFQNLQTLKVLGFEDIAMLLFLPQLNLPKLRCLQIIGSCQRAAAQKAILTLLHRHGHSLHELELNVWTEFLCEADDPIIDIGKLPHVRRLTIRAPPLPVPWERFAETCPNLEELTFLYDQDFTLNSAEVIEECEDPLQQAEMLERHTLRLYRDAVTFARELHSCGFQRLGRSCPNLKVICLTVSDSSFGYDITPSDDRLAISWRRDLSPDAPTRSFRRNPEQNNATRATLEAQINLPIILGVRDLEDLEEASSAGAHVMLQVIRMFDNPSLEAEFGLRPL